MTTLRPHFDELLPPAEADLLHQRSLDLLWDPGIKFNCHPALDLLERHDCPVDRERLTVQIPGELVAEALEAAPRVVRLAARNPDDDLVLDGRDVHFTLSSQGIHTIESETGALRETTSADLGRAMRLADALPAAEILNVIVAAQDVPTPVRVLHHFATSWTNTGKHIRTGVLEAQQVPFLMEMAEIVSDGQAVTERGAIFSAIDCTISPLQHHPTMTVASMALAEHGIPILVYPMPLAGATAPNSPAGTALIANAEFLSSLVLYQCLKPGASLIYGIGSSTMDMRTGAFEYGPDAQLSTLMLAGMAHRYNLPLNTAGLGTGAKHLGPQCGWETLANATLSVLAGSDEAYGLGQFDDAKVLSLEKLVYDAEQARQLKRLSRGVDFDHKRLLADVIARVGFDDHYLRQPETRDLMRSEIEIPKLDDDRTQAEWLAAGRDEQARLSQVVEALLASHQPPPLPEGAQYKMDRILEEAAHTFAGEAAS